MVQPFPFRDSMRWNSSGFAVVCLLCLLVAGSAQSECQEPADEFSEKIDSLLTSVEGPDFPTPANLASWPARNDEIQTAFAEIFALTEGDDDRRGAAIAALLAAEAIARSDWKSDMELGEARAWSRRVLKDASDTGITAADRKFLYRRLLAELITSLDNQHVEHPERSLPFYQEKATALRDLASSSCEKKS